MFLERLVISYSRFLPSSKSRAVVVVRGGVLRGGVAAVARRREARKDGAINARPAQRRFELRSDLGLKLIRVVAVPCVPAVSPLNGED